MSNLKPLRDPAKAECSDETSWRLDPTCCPSRSNHNWKMSGDLASLFSGLNDERILVKGEVNLEMSQNKICANIRIYFSVAF